MSNKRARVIGMGKDIFKDDDDLEQNHPLDSFITDEARFINLSLDQIIPNPEQPRKFFSEEGLRDLAESIKQHGVLQPIIVQKNEDDFMLVAGERRFRAAKLAGLAKIPALIKSDNPLEVSVIENIQREDLKPLEEAEGLQLLVDRFGYTHEDLAKIIGKSRSSITEILSLNKLPGQIKFECRTSDIYSKSLLLQVIREQNEDKMLALWEKIKEGNLSVKKAKKVLQRQNRLKPYEHKFISPNKDFSVTIRFKKSQINKEEIRIAFETAYREFFIKISNNTLDI